MDYDADKIMDSKRNRKNEKLNYMVLYELDRNLSRGRRIIH